MSTPEIKAYLLVIQHQEEKAREDIRIGLLATLSEYRGPSKVKLEFEKAIKDVTP